jgi:hypothetical protein
VGNWLEKVRAGLVLNHQDCDDDVSSESEEQKHHERNIPRKGAHLLPCPRYSLREGPRLVRPVDDLFLRPLPIEVRLGLPRINFSLYSIRP